LHGGGLDVRLSVYLRAVPVDSDGDGFPDAAELADPTDRDRFAAWFCAIAESQFYGVWDGWIAEQRDCAGLVRFAWREALARHDPAWFAKAGRNFSFPMPDVAAFRVPEIPFLGDRPFRIRPPGGTFHRDDFSAFADAQHLLAYNVVPVTGGLAEARPGDLLFFRNDDLDLQDPADRMHIMIWLGERPDSSGERRPMLVYHTGSLRTGEVRRTPLAVLLAHPDSRWHPVPGNPSFLGVFRPAIAD
jgi:hypothetical protein